MPTAAAAAATAVHHTNGVSNGGLAITTNATNSIATNGSAMNCSSDGVACMNNNGRSTILCGGIRARMRLRTNNSNVQASANGHPIVAGPSLSADGSYMLTARSINDLRNTRLTPNDPSNRRHSEFPEAQQHSRSVGNLGITTISCGPSTSRSSGMSWDPSQALVPCNGASSNQRNFVVNSTQFWIRSMEKTISFRLFSASKRVITKYTCSQ